jgi:hypothetical protein
VDLNQLSRDFEAMMSCMHVLSSIAWGGFYGDFAIYPAVDANLIRRGSRKEPSGLGKRSKRKVSADSNSEIYRHPALREDPTNPVRHKLDKTLM